MEVGNFYRLAITVNQLSVESGDVFQVLEIEPEHEGKPEAVTMRNTRTGQDFKVLAQDISQYERVMFPNNDPDFKPPDTTGLNIFD